MRITVEAVVQAELTAVWDAWNNPADIERWNADFEGTYTRIVPHRTIEYRMSDGRQVKVEVVERPGGVLVRETFDAETRNPPQMQRRGWQAILDNFRRHVEARG